MSASDWFSLALICTLGAASPGPSLLVVIAAARLRGRGGGCAAALGHGLGVFLYALMAAASLSYILAHHANLFQFVQVAGALMLAWIGIRLIMAKRRDISDKPLEAQAFAISRSFRDGFVIAVLNPKIAAFFGSLFSLYLEGGQTTALHIVMAALAGGIDMIVYVLIVLVATMPRVTITFAKYASLNDLILGLVLVGFGMILFAQIFIN